MEGVDLVTGGVAEEAPPPQPAKKEGRSREMVQAAARMETFSFTVGCTPKESRGISLKRLGKSFHQSPPQPRGL
jgi:hypothetical protein